MAQKGNSASHNNSRNAAVRDALLGGGPTGGSARSGPPVTDGVLTVTPDAPEILDWRARSALDVAETSSTYLDDEDDGPKPHELYGKFTWKIGSFSDISKRELRSTTFDVGGYKWYVLIYPQGCDVCNHLSLFLCVADYDKLLPGWSHFAQFTIAVVNKDPKKSKYSDTLHRFCKKEHDWGWKKFMELSKVLDGFTVADTLVIKAQVQVILDKPGKPFRCLDPQYRRELVRVYLTNVEGVCRRFCDEKRTRLVWAKDEALKFRDVWRQLSAEDQRRLLSEKAEVILKGVVKQFFNEKEVTSTLVMDALYSGCKQIDEHSRKYLEGTADEEPPVVLVRSDRSVFMLNGDIMEIADRATKDFIPTVKDDGKMLQPNDGLSLRSGQDDDYRRDTIERDEKRLAELGRKTVEMFVISQVFTERLEVAYREAEALKRQDQLIAEELALQQQEDLRRREQAEREKEKRSKKKERMKQRKEAERAKRDAEDAEKLRAQEAAKRKDQERRAAEAALADKKRQAEAAHALSPHTSKHQLQQQQQQQQQRGTRAAPEDAASASPASPSQAPGAKQGKQQQQQQPQPLPQPSSSVQQAKSKGPTAGRGVSHTDPSRLAAAPSPAASSQQPPLSRPLHMPPASGCSRGRGAGRGGKELAMDSSASSSQDRADLEDSDDAGSHRRGGALKQSGGQETESVSDRSDEVELDLLRTQVHQLQLLLAERDAEIFALQMQLNELQPLAASAVSLKATLAAMEAGTTEGGAPASSSGVPFASAEAVEVAPSTRGAPNTSSSSSSSGGQKAGIGMSGRVQQHQHKGGGVANGSSSRQQQQHGAGCSLPHVASKEGGMGELARSGSTSSLASSVASEVVAPPSSSGGGGAKAGAGANGFLHHHAHHSRGAAEQAAAASSSSTAGAAAQPPGPVAARKAAAAAAAVAAAVAGEAALPSGVPGAAFDTPASAAAAAATSHTQHLHHHARSNGPHGGPLSPAQPSQRSGAAQPQASGNGGHHHTPAHLQPHQAGRMHRGDTTVAVLAGKVVVPPPPPPPPSSRPPPASSTPSTATSAGPASAAQALFPPAAASTSSSSGSGGRLRTAPLTATGQVPGVSPLEPPSSSSSLASAAAASTAVPIASSPTTTATAPIADPPPAAPSYRNAAAGVTGGISGAAATSNAAAVAAAAAAAATVASRKASQHAATSPSATSTSAAPAAGGPAKQLNAGASEFPGQRLLLSQAEVAAAAAAVAAGSASAAVPASSVATAVAAAAASEEQQQAGVSTPAQQARLASSQLPADSPGLDDFAHMGLIDDLLGAE